MRDLFQETVIGQVIHWCSGGRVLAYPEPMIVKQEGPSRYMKQSESSTTDIGRVTTEKDSETALRVVTWDGPEDPLNPQNWSIHKKIFVTALICLLTFSIYIGSAIYTAGTEGIMLQYKISSTVATLGLSLFVLGYATGPMVWAPIAEAPLFGRTTVYMFTQLCFVALNFGVIYASNIGMLLIFRFLTGFFGSPVLATGGASLADLWSPQKRAYAIGIWGLFAVLGPTGGPLVGGFAVEAETWTWPIWVLIWLNAFCFVLLMFTLPETSSQNILFRRAWRLRHATSNTSFVTEAELYAKPGSTSKKILGILWRPFRLCFTEAILLATNVYLGLIYAILYTWFEAFPLVYFDIYHFDLSQNGLAFLGILTGSIIITIPYMYWLRHFQEPRFDADGNLNPESRLTPAIVGSLFIPVSLFWFAWTSREDIPWIVPTIGSALFPMGAVLLFNSVLLYQGDSYPEYVGSVLAGNDLVRGGFGAGFPIFAPAMFHKLGIGWGGSLLGFLSIVFIPLPILLYKFGKRMRMASPNARHDI